MQLLEGGDVQRHLVVEEPHPAAQERARIFGQHVGEGHPGRKVVALGDAVVVVARAQVEGEAPVQVPFVVEEERELGLVAAQRRVAHEVNPFCQGAIAATDLDRPAPVGAVKVVAGEVEPQLQPVLPAGLTRGQAVDFQQLVAPAGAVLGVEEAAGLAFGPKHKRRAGGSGENVGVKVLHAEGGFQQRAIGKDVAVLRPRHPAALAVVGGGRLRREGVQGGEAVLLRVEAENGGEFLGGAEAGVQLGEGVEAFDVGVPFELRQAGDGIAGEAILERLQDGQPVFDQRAGERDPGRGPLHSADAAVAPAEAGEEIVELEAPLVARRLGFDGGDRAGELAVFGRVGVGENFHFLDDVHRQVDGLLAGHGVGDVGAVHQPAGLGGVGAFNFYQPVRAAQHARHQRQRVQKALGGQRRILVDRACQFRTGGGLFGLDALGPAGDGDFLPKHLECERNRNLQWTSGLDQYVLSLRFVPFQRDCQRVGPGRDIRKAVGAGGIAAGREGRAGLILQSQREGRPRQAERFATGSDSNYMAGKLPGGLSGDEQGRQQHSSQQQAEKNQT